MDVRELFEWLALALVLLGVVAVFALAAVVAFAHVRLWWWRRQFRRVR